MKIFSIAALLLLVTVSAYCQTDTSRKIVDLDYTIPDRYIIGGINVQGDKYMDKAVVISLSGLDVGQMVSVPGTEISQAIQNLWDQKLFSDVSILADSVSGNKIYLTISVRSRPRLTRYKFSGIKRAEEKRIKEEIAISRGEIVSEHLLTGIRDKIKRYYRDKGHPNAEVKIKAEPDTGAAVNTVVLDINIHKNKRTRISCITFRGNTEFTDNRLRRLMKNTKRYRLWTMIKGSKFKEANYEEDKASIVAFYQKHGFKDARIVDDSVYLCKDNFLNIGITIEEGTVYYFRNIAWAGNSKYSSKFLEAILGINKGDIYNPEVLDRNLYINPNGLDVSSLYMDQGYLFFNATPVEVRVEGDSVDLEIRIFEGPQATIRNVTVSGNTKTYDHVILRELRTRPGKKFSRSDVIRSQRELAALGYFDPEKINVIPKPNLEEGTVDIEYIVEEKSSDQIELSGGVSQGQIVGILGLSLNNFSARQIFKPKMWQGYPSGDGQRLSLRAQTNGRAYQSYNLSFTEPWFGGKKPNSLTVSGFYSAFNNNAFRNTDVKSGMNTMGGTVGLGWRLKWPDDFFTAHLAASYQYYVINNLAGAFISGFDNGYANNLNGRLLLARNSTSDPIYPRSGSSLTMMFQFTPPYSLFSDKDYSSLPVNQKYKWTEYHKTKFDFSTYMGFGAKKNLVLMAGFNFGFLGTWNNELGITPFERFYLGGEGLNAGLMLDGREYIRLRGYDDESDVTPIILDPVTGAAVERGGTIYDRFTLELRYPVATTPAATIYGLAFFEAGNAWQKYSNFNPLDMKRGAGAGVRIYLPMFGLLGFDYGFGLDPSLVPGKERGQFHFLIGQSLF